MNREHIPYFLIENHSGLFNIAAELSKESVIGIDLEADSLFHYREKVCLLQISTPHKNIVIDHFGQKDKNGKYDEWNFPNYTDYYSKKLKFGKVIKTDGLWDEDTHFLDLSTSLPGSFAHRYHLKKKKFCDYGVNGNLRVIVVPSPNLLSRSIVPRSDSIFFLTTSIPTPRPETLVTTRNY